MNWVAEVEYEACALPNTGKHELRQQRFLYKNNVGPIAASEQPSVERCCTDGSPTYGPSESSRERQVICS